MEIASDFRLSLAPDEAYKLLVDLDEVVPCLPGAELGESLPDGSRQLKVHVKLGPMRFVYDGTVQIVERDQQARRALLSAVAREARGQGDAKASVAMSVGEVDGGGASVSTTADVSLTGRAGQMGQGIVQAVAKQLIGQMVVALEARHAQATPGAAEVPVEANGSPRGPATSAADRQAPAAVGPPNARPVKAGRIAFLVLKDWLRALVRRRRR